MAVTENTLKQQTPKKFYYKMHNMCSYGKFLLSLLFIIHIIARFICEKLTAIASCCQPSIIKVKSQENVQLNYS